MTRLCLTLSQPTLEANLRDLADSSPDLAELRIDLLESMDMKELVLFPDKAGIPLILTCRYGKDGGAFNGSSALREALLLGLMDGNYSYLDIEEDETSELLVRKAGERGIKIIRSLHDFNKVPEILYTRLESMALRGDLVKAAVSVSNIRDLNTLFETAETWERAHPGEDRLILLGMGPFGVPSRILAGYMGSFLSFCSPPGYETAPGHMDWKTLHDIYRAGEIDKHTLLYGIVGNPVLHTRSPHIHNPGFHKNNLRAVYVPFTVDELEPFFELAERLNIRGFSVTVPHKEEVRSFLQKEDQAVQSVGACNTVIRGEAGWEGYNTDVLGFIEPLKAVTDLKERKALVIGAGGAARSAVYALQKEGCEVHLFNRTLERAQDLIREFGCEGGSLLTLREEMEKGQVYDLVIQTTSVGMHGGKGPDNPVPFYSFRGTEIVYDIIYNPPETALMKCARRAGCTVLGGMPMLQEQAAAQFRLFTGDQLL